MKISVITVSFNSADTIEDTIKSVLEQDYKDLEYIIIDGDSKDGTKNILDKYKDKISLVISEKDNGMYDALNKGIDFAKGEVISILNSDDFYANKNVISKVAEQFAKQKCECVYSDLNFVDRNNPEKITRKWIAGNYSEGKFLQGWMPPHPTFFVKKSCYQNFGKFNTSLKYAADYELMLRFIHKHKISISYIPEVLIKMRTGGFGNKNVLAKIHANLEDRKAWRMNNLKPNFLTLWMKPLSKLFQYT